MTAHSIVVAIMAISAVAAAFRYREEIEEALRRGPWNGGGPSPPAPAPAADPFGPPFSRTGRPHSTDIR